jgi:hypothetical protein
LYCAVDIKLNPRINTEKERDKGKEKGEIIRKTFHRIQEIYLPDKESNRFFETQGTFNPIQILQI